MKYGGSVSKTRHDAGEGNRSKRRQCLTSALTVSSGFIEGASPVGSATRSKRGVRK